MKLCNKERIAFVRWCIENGHTIIAQKFADAQHFPEFFPKIPKLLRQRFCTDKRSYYRTVYLKSEHWSKLKNSKLEKHKCCELCGNCHSLDIHHIRYKNLYDVTADDLRVLCRKCHNVEHNVKKILEKFHNGLIA